MSDADIASNLSSVTPIASGRNHNNEEEGDNQPNEETTRAATTSFTELADTSDSDLQLLTTLALATLQNRGSALPIAPALLPSPKNDIYNNARFEQITCAGLLQKYDGSPDNLIPTLNFN